MTDQARLMELICPSCNTSNICSVGEMKKWLMKHGKLRRTRDPELELIEELFLVSANKFTCDECGHVGMIVRAAEQLPDDEWDMARRCETCGQPISNERLEIFRNTRVCMSCKDDEERGHPHEEPEYCPRCGGVMEMKPEKGPGITRYEYRCRECR